MEAMRELGVVEKALGDAHVKLAGGAADPAAAIRELREGRDRYRRSAALFTDMKAKGILSESDAQLPDALGRLAERCDEEVRKLEQELDREHTHELERTGPSRRGPERSDSRFEIREGLAEHGRGNSPWNR